MEAQTESTDNRKPKNEPMSPRKEMLLFLLIPASVILLVAMVLWLPALFAKPKYDFIYSYCSDYRCSSEYRLESGAIIQDGNGADYGYGYNTRPDLYYYDVDQNTAKKIDLAEARSYKLSAAVASPDGYRLEQLNTGGGGFLFWGGAGDDNWYLKDGFKKKKVILSPDAKQYYGDNIKLLGWVEE